MQPSIMQYKLLLIIFLKDHPFCYRLIKKILMANLCFKNMEEIRYNNLAINSKQIFWEDIFLIFNLQGLLSKTYVFKCVITLRTVNE